MGWTCRDRVVLVVGATRGIGRSIALALAGCGATVVVTGRDDDAASRVAAECGAAGGQGYAARLDVRDPAETEATIGEIVRQHGRLDAVVASAGVNPYFERAERLTPAMWDDVMAVNLRGVFFSIRAAAGPMLAAGGGSIVVVSSVMATRPLPRTLPYTATKGALDAIVRALAVEWADRGVRVNGIAPGWVATDLTAGVRHHASLQDEIIGRTPMARFGNPDEIGSLAAYLVSEASSFVTGQIIAVDGGYAVG